MRQRSEQLWRRRLGALALVAVVAATVGVAVGAGGGGDPGRVSSDPLTKHAGDRQLAVRQAVGQLLVMAFDGTTAPDYIRRLRDGEGAGVALFGGNVVDAAQLAAAQSSIQRSARGGALIATPAERDWRARRPHLPRAAAPGRPRPSAVTHLRYRVVK